MISLSRAACSLVTLALIGACSTPSEPGPSPTPAPGDPTPANPPSTSTPPSTPAPPADTSPTTTEPPEDPGPPALRIIGRYDDTDPKGPIFGWPGSRVIANFEGTGVSVRLGERSFEGGPSEWDVAIDGVYRPDRLVLQDGEHTYELASDLPPGKHRIEIYRRSEGQNGITQFLGYDYKGGTLLPPPLRLKRKIEIIGDSDVSGFGYMGAVTGTCEPGPIWSAHLQDYRQAWGERLATKLNAEMNSEVFSGKGFYYNIWRPDLETIGVLYPRSNPVDAHSQFDLTKFVPDAVVVSIGGNDYNIGVPTDNGAAPLEGFTQKAREMTQTLRRAYPQAHIFLMAYAVLTDEYPPGRGRRTNVETALKTITAESNTAGDARVYFVAPPPSTDAELTACDGHGGPEYHERIAVYMAEQMMAKTGWK